ncbi:MFS general substrate transporter [Cadophora sp. DSE1049]|nr:MFS general substrate transporter [Cadophora sp. DSE1049]
MPGSLSDMKAADVAHLEVVQFSSSEYETQLLVDRGNIIIEEERNYSIWQALKKNKRAAGYAALSFSGGLAFGYDTIVNGATVAMPAFILTFGETGPTGPYLPSTWTSLWISMSALVQTLTALSGGWVADRWGRKWPASASGILTLIGTAMQYVTTTRALLLGGKMTTGAGLGIAMSIATSYASEVSPLNLRGPIQSALVLATLFTQGAALGVIRAFVPDLQPSSFRTVFAIQWAVGGLVVIAFAIAPESPVYLIKKGRVAEALNIMRKLYSPKNDPDARLACLIRTLREEKESSHGEDGSFMECFRGANLKRTTTALLIYSCQNFAGAAFLSNALYFLIIAGLKPIHAFDIGIGGFGLACVTIIALWFVGDKIKGRTMYFAGLSINTAFMLIVGCLYYASGVGPIWTIAVLMSVAAAALQGLVQGSGFPIAAQVSKLSLRAKTISLAVAGQTFTTWLTLFIMPYIYNVDAGNLLARTGFIFAGTGLFLFVASWYLIPDTTGMDAEDIDFAYENKIPAWSMNLAAVQHRHLPDTRKQEA